MQFKNNADQTAKKVQRSEEEQRKIKYLSDYIQINYPLARKKMKKNPKFS